METGVIISQCLIVSFLEYKGMHVDNSFDLEIEVSKWLNLSFV